MGLSRTKPRRNEREPIARILEDSQGNRALAERLGVSRRTLVYALTALGLLRPTKKGEAPIAMLRTAIVDIVQLTMCSDVSYSGKDRSVAGRAPGLFNFAALTVAQCHTALAQACCYEAPLARLRVLACMHSLAPGASIS